MQSDKNEEELRDLVKKLYAADAAMKSFHMVGNIQSREKAHTLLNQIIQKIEYLGGKIETKSVQSLTFQIVEENMPGSEKVPLASYTNAQNNKLIFPYEVDSMTKVCIENKILNA